MIEEQQLSLRSPQSWHGNKGSIYKIGGSNADKEDGGQKDCESLLAWLRAYSRQEAVFEGKLQA
ncbi:MAG TPA: hypothetical protein VGD64_13535 [Acidisarcina sp.]